MQAMVRRWRTVPRAPKAVVSQATKLRAATAGQGYGGAEQSGASRSRHSKKKKTAASTPAQIANYEANFYRGREAILQNRETNLGIDTVVVKDARGREVGHWLNNDNVVLLSHRGDTHEVVNQENDETSFVKCWHLLFEEQARVEEEDKGAGKASRRPRPPPPSLPDDWDLKLDWWNHGKYQAKVLPPVPKDEARAEPSPPHPRPSTRTAALGSSVKLVPAAEAAAAGKAPGSEVLQKPFRPVPARGSSSSQQEEKKSRNPAPARVRGPGAASSSCPEELKELGGFEWTRFGPREESATCGRLPE